MHLSDAEAGARPLFQKKEKGTWADSQKLRQGMDYADIVKVQGYSWIEVMKEVHTIHCTTTRAMVCSVQDEPFW